MTPVASIQAALDQIEKGLTGPLPVEGLARRASMSSWHFQRTFSVLVGESVAAYIRQRRLTEAARRLRERPETILEVALDYQFDSHEAFTRAFRSRFFYTPSAWRRGRGALNRPFDPVRLNEAATRKRFSRMKLTPDILTLPEATYVGLQAPFIMVISPDANNLKVIPQLWKEFLARRHEVPQGPGGAGPTFGLSQSPEAVGAPRTHPDEAMYLAAVELPVGAKVPKGMVGWKVPKGTYARFLHEGPVQTVGDTYGAIYGRWLGTSGYQRGRGPDIERYDARFTLGSPDSVFEILVPVTKG